VALDDVRLLAAAKGAWVITDTAIRFVTVTDDNSAAEISQTLSSDFLKLMNAECRGVVPLFHSPKSFGKDTSMTQENMIRGTGEFAAILATAWGVRQLDKVTNTIHIENIKPRDFEPCGPFQLTGRPAIDEKGDFALHSHPEVCSNLSEQPEVQKNKGGASEKKREERIVKVALMTSWLREDANLTSGELIERYAANGMTVADGTVRLYRREAIKQIAQP
jgi:hypothetical protein